MPRSRSQPPLPQDSDSEQEDISINFAEESDASDDVQDVEDWEEEEEAGGEANRTGEAGAGTSASPQIPAENLLSKIKNKLKRRQMFEKQESEKRAALRKQKKRGVSESGEEKRPTRTIDNACGFAETLPDDSSQAGDPFTCYFNKEKEPKLLMTTVEHPRVRTIRFCQEFARTIPNLEFKFRRNCSVKGTMKAAHERGYTHLLVVNQDGRKPNGILMIHLPDGPTANFKLSSVKYHKEIRHSGAHSSERPEIIVNNFHTRLGQTIGRLFVSLCHFDPQFKGRRVVTFHNQRDYIFFRHHRYALIGRFILSLLFPIATGTSSRTRKGWLCRRSVPDSRSACAGSRRDRSTQSPNSLIGFPNARKRTAVAGDFSFYSVSMLVLILSLHQRMGSSLRDTSLY